MGKTVHYAVVLGLICVVMGFAIGYSYYLMKDRIAQKELEVTLSALGNVLFPGKTVKAWREDTGASTDETRTTLAAIDDAGDTVGYVSTLNDTRFDTPGVVIVGLDNERQTIAYLAVGEEQGYSSKVRVMVGVRPDVTDLDRIEIIGVAVVSQQETPGLGTRIEERRSSKSLWDVITLSSEKEVFTSPFLDQFGPDPEAGRPGKTYRQLEEVVKNPDPNRIQAVTAATISSTAATDAVRNAIERIREVVMGGDGRGPKPEARSQKTEDAPQMSGS